MANWVIAVEMEYDAGVGYLTVDGYFDALPNG